VKTDCILDRVSHPNTQYLLRLTGWSRIFKPGTTLVPHIGALAAHCATGFSPKIAGSPEAMMGFPKFASSPVFQLEGLQFLSS